MTSRPSDELSIKVEHVMKTISEYVKKLKDECNKWKTSKKSSQRQVPSTTDIQIALDALYNSANELSTTLKTTEKQDGTKREPDNGGTQMVKQSLESDKETGASNESKTGGGCEKTRGKRPTSIKSSDPSQDKNKKAPYKHAKDRPSEKECIKKSKQKTTIQIGSSQNTPVPGKAQRTPQDEPCENKREGHLPTNDPQSGDSHVMNTGSDAERDNTATDIDAIKSDKNSTVKDEDANKHDSSGKKAVESQTTDRIMGDRPIEHQECDCKIAELQQKLNKMKHETEQQTIKLKEQHDTEKYQTSQHFEEIIRRVKRENQELTNDIKAIEKKLKRIERENADLKLDNADLFDRFSKQAADKMGSKNPDVADLSDVNRAENIADKYNQLYDIPWTKAFLAQRKYLKLDEKTNMQSLLDLLKDVYSYCEMKAKEQMGQLTNIFQCPVQDGNMEKQIKFVEITGEKLHSLLELRKQFAVGAVKLVTEGYFNYSKGKPVENITQRRVVDVDHIQLQTDGQTEQKVAGANKETLETSKFAEADNKHSQTQQNVEPHNADSKMAQPQPNQKLDSNDVDSKQSHSQVKESTKANDAESSITGIKTDPKVNEAMKAYTQKCVEVCWLMVLHNPPLYMETTVNAGDPVCLEEYNLRSDGAVVDMLVWPPLYRGHGGRRLSKGVVQGRKSILKPSTV